MQKEANSRYIKTLRGKGTTYKKFTLPKGGAFMDNLFTHMCVNKMPIHAVEWSELEGVFIVSTNVTVEKMERLIECLNSKTI